jgi:hypothetical protein
MFDKSGMLLGFHKKWAPFARKSNTRDETRMLPSVHMQYTWPMGSVRFSCARSFRSKKQILLLQKSFNLIVGRYGMCSRALVVSQPAIGTKIVLYRMGEAIQAFT